MRHGVCLLAVAALLAGGAACGGAAEPAPVALPAQPRADVVPSKAPRLVAPEVGFSWRRAGAFVWHTSHVDPTILGAAMRRARFGWLAVMLADGLRPAPVDEEWLVRFRAASGLPVGGWSVLRDAPVREARLAARLLHAHGMDFHVANAELEYAYTNDSAWSAERYGRSGRFVAAFRKRKPALPAALSSYCRADQHDLDWSAWRRARFAFLPQAYVNEFGGAAAPRVCAASAAGVFARTDVHPTIGAWGGRLAKVAPHRYARLLREAGTTGFSVYLAENGMAAKSWDAYGRLLARHRLAVPAQAVCAPSPAVARCR